MIEREPEIRVGIVDRRPEVRGRFNGTFLIQGRPVTGIFSAKAEEGGISFTDSAGERTIAPREIRCIAGEGSTFTLFDVTIGVRFHWERMEEESFRGSLTFLARPEGTLTAVNEIGLEDYLASVISSEMNPQAPMELLKAHSVTSRSWLVSMLERARPGAAGPDSGSQGTVQREGEVIRWYGREDHDLFDVCADDHCQRYQGVTKVIPDRTAKAVEETRGLFLVHEGAVCDARYHKACGGITENFEKVWEDRKVPYLISVPDSPDGPAPLRFEDEAARWILSSPRAYCNTKDADVLSRILPSFDRETGDFFRWKVEYHRAEIEEILKVKSGIDFGVLRELVPLERGPSGRIVRLRIKGSKAEWIVGKELEIRRWLSPSHLLSSAFVVSVERDPSGNPSRFILHGAGWGHGVGLCQIGAAMMAVQGFGAAEILRHYFRGAVLRKLYR